MKSKYAAKLALAPLAAAMFFSSASWAQSGASMPSPMPPSLRPSSCSTLQVAQRGSPLPAIHFKAQQWVEGAPGSEYSLVATNHCPYRILAVMSVDGLNVLDGELASFASQGYVLESGQSANISGWRKTSDRVAAFYFSRPEQSYAARVGKGGNQGVIAAAFFAEIAPPPPPAPAPAPAPAPVFSAPMGEAPRAMGAAPSAQAMENAAGPSGSAMDRAAPAPAAKSAARPMATPVAPSLGTGHGRSIESHVETTSFKRNAQPFHVQEIRYESRERLEEMGALPKRRVGPNPFPGQAEPTYVPDPPPMR